MNVFNSSIYQTLFSYKHGRSRLLVTMITAIVVGLALITLSPGHALADGGFSGLVQWFSDDVINGRGTSITSNGSGLTTASWSDGHNKLKVRIDGDVAFTDDDHAIRRIPEDGSIAIWEKRGSKTSELKVTVGRSGEFEYAYKVDDKKTDFDAAGGAWLAEVLVDVVRKTGIGAEERADWILDRDGVNGLLKEMQYVESDYVMRIFLGTALSRPDLTTADCGAILEEAALSMDSDYEKAELLLSVANHPNWNSSLADDYVGVAETMESDYEIRRSLSALQLDETSDPKAIDGVLKIAARMESDYEVAELLISFAPLCQSSQQLSNMYVSAASGIDSDYEARRALTALNWRKGLSPEAVVGALNVAGRLGSDYEAAELLIELAPYGAIDARSVTAFMTAIGHVGSDYEAARSLSAFAAADQLSESATLAALDASTKISSSYEKSGVLAKLLQHCRGNEKLEDAYLAAVDTIDGDYERDNLYTEFYRGNRGARRGQ